MAAFFNPKSRGSLTFDDDAIRMINARQAQLLIAAGAIILALLVLLAVLALRPRIPAYVVALDTKSGAVLGIAHTVAGADTLPSAVARYVVVRFIEDARTVSDNLDLERDHLNAVYATARGQALKAVDDYYKTEETHNPMKQALASHWTEVSITRCLKQPEPNSFLVEWSEESHAAHSQLIGTAKWQALVKVAVTDPDPDNALNPTGIYLVNLDWSPAPAMN